MKKIILYYQKHDGYFSFVRENHETSFVVPLIYRKLRKLHPQVKFTRWELNSNRTRINVFYENEPPKHPHLQ